MKIEDSFRIVEREYGDGKIKFIIQDHHIDYEWQDNKSYPVFCNLQTAKDYKEILIKVKKKSTYVSERVVG